MSQFLHDNNKDNNDAKTIAMPRVLPKNSQAKNLENKTKNVLKNGW